MAVSHFYAISKYDKEDLAALLSVYNVAIDQIDALIRRLEDTLTEVQVDILDLQSRVAILENRVTKLEQRVNAQDVTINNMSNKYDAAIKAIVDKVFGGGTIDFDKGTIEWGSDGRIAVGTMNWYSGADNSNWIKTRADADGDMRGQ